MDGSETTIEQGTGDFHVDLYSRYVNAFFKEIGQMPEEKMQDRDPWGDPLTMVAEMRSAGIVTIVSTVNTFNPYDPKQSQMTFGFPAGVDHHRQLATHRAIRLIKDPKTELVTNPKVLQVVPFSEGWYDLSPKSIDKLLNYLAGRKILGFSPTWIYPGPFGASQKLTGEKDTGMSEAMLTVVRELNTWEKKPFIDPSHGSRKMMMGIHELYQGPVVVTHANYWNFHPNDPESYNGVQNLRDDFLNELKQREGSDGTVATFTWLRAVGNTIKSNEDAWDRLRNHFEGMLKILGPDKVAWATDPSNDRNLNIQPEILAPYTVKIWIEKLRSWGYDEELIRKVTLGNMHAFLKLTY